MNHRIAWLDVFAERPLAGNGLAVVDDADEISDETMLAFAKEMDLSETTFVQSPEAEGADYRNRIFTVATELPFAGHPSLGTAVAVARWRGQEEASFVQETGAGLQPIEVRAEGERWRADMVQNEPEFGTELDVEAVMHAVGLNPAEAHQELAPQVVSTGLPTAVVPVSEAESLAADQTGLRGDRRCSRGARSRGPARRRTSTSSGPTPRPGRRGRGCSRPWCREARIPRPARRPVRWAPTWPSTRGASGW